MTQAPAPSRPAARERILEAASRLFVRDGFRAVGVDTVIAEAGVAKMTLYAHFPSKDDLIAAYLERANERFWRWLDTAVAGVDDPRAKLVSMFHAVGKLANDPQCLGCTFQGTAAEFPDPEHPGHRVALAHKQAVLARLGTLAREADLRDPEALADQLLLLMDGAWVAARMFGPGNPSAQVAAAATALIQAHSRPKPVEAG
ncbi:MAG TPA: TetR/AcrR family transcriptional regulator [Actinomycetes bacterium]|nr:TetR/AcrR family transcriptional regulator [Actinomycetes bacterium]